MDTFKYTCIYTYEYLQLWVVIHSLILCDMNNCEYLYLGILTILRIGYII